MEDVIQVVGAGSGYAILALAIVVWWRMYRYLEKDRDFWRNEALGRKQVADTALDVGKRMLKPLKKVEALTDASSSEERIAQLEEVVRMLLAGADREGRG